MLHRSLILALFASLLLGCANSARTGSVIFIHPDGTGPNTWAAARILHKGPDGDLEWDKMPQAALYRGHLSDRLNASSNGGGTIHAFGVKTSYTSFGMTTGGDDARPIVDDQGQSLSVARQAIRAGLPVGLVQTGISAEPGTACFLASVPARNMYAEICKQLIESGATVLFGAGERHFLPKGVQGVFGPGEREDGLNLFDLARSKGYTVVQSRAELLALPANTERVLGVFAYDATFNAAPEETLAAQGKPLYEPGTPTVGEMTEVALRILEAKNKRFLLVVEEEGTDNFANNGNASGTLEALRRADEAIGLARRFLAKHPNTLVFTAADSDAGGMQVMGLGKELKPGMTVPAQSPETGPVDGVAGANSAPFLAGPDRFGQRMPFAICWASIDDDFAGGVVVRAEGLNADQIHGSFDNTRIAEMIRLTLFGTK
jgi:alkaline phosphatase